MTGRDVHCAECADTGLVLDRDDVDEDGARRQPCARCQYRVWARNRIVWWGEASSTVDALDRARRARPELLDEDFAATSPSTIARAS